MNEGKGVSEVDNHHLHLQTQACLEPGVWCELSEHIHWDEKLHERKETNQRILPLITCNMIYLFDIIEDSKL